MVACVMHTGLCRRGVVPVSLAPSTRPPSAAHQHDLCMSDGVVTSRRLGVCGVTNGAIACWMRVLCIALSVLDAVWVGALLLTPAALHHRRCRCSTPIYQHDSKAQTQHDVPVPGADNSRVQVCLSRYASVIGTWDRVDRCDLKGAATSAVPAQPGVVRHFVGGHRGCHRPHQRSRSLGKTRV